MNSQQIAALSIIVNASARGAIHEIENLDAVAKVAGVGITKNLVASAEAGAAAWDKALNQIASKLSRGIVSPSDMQKLDQLRYTFQQLGNAAGAPERLGLAGELSNLANKRRMATLPEMYGISQDNPVYNTPFGPSRREWERAQRRQEMYNSGVRSAGGLNILGPSNILAHNQMLENMAGPMYGPSREDLLAYRHNANPMYGPSREGFDAATRQRMDATQLPILNSPNVLAHQKALEDNTREIKLNTARAVRPGTAFRHRLLQEYNSGKDGQRRINAMRRLIAKQQKKGYQAQLRQIDAVLGMGPRSSLADLHGIRTGRNSDSRNMRYISQNLAYGFEDAAISYQTGGISGAVRGATNNLTAVAGAAIPHPGAAAAAIVAISLVSTIAPSIAKFIESSIKGAEVSKEFEQSLQKLVNIRVDQGSFLHFMSRNELQPKIDALRSLRSELVDLQQEAGAISQTAAGGREAINRGMENNTMWRMGSNTLGAISWSQGKFRSFFGFSGELSPDRQRLGTDAEKMALRENAEAELGGLATKSADVATQIAIRNAKIREIEARRPQLERYEENRMRLSANSAGGALRADLAIARISNQDYVPVAERYALEQRTRDSGLAHFRTEIVKPGYGLTPEEQHQAIRQREMEYRQQSSLASIRFQADSIRERISDERGAKSFRQDSFLNQISRDPERAAYANYFRRQEAIRKMRGLSDADREQYSEGSRLTYNLEAIEGRMANGIRAEFKPFLDDNDVGSKSDLELFNKFQYGNQQTDQAERKEALRLLKLFEEKLQGILQNTVPKPPLPAKKVG